MEVIPLSASCLLAFFFLLSRMKDSLRQMLDFCVFHSLPPFLNGEMFMIEIMVLKTKATFCGVLCNFGLFSQVVFFA